MSATVLRLVEASGNDGALRRALLSLLADDRRLRRLFEGACRGGVFRLRDETPAFRAALSANGYGDHRGDGLEDALYALALDLLPDSPASAWARLQMRRKNREREAAYPSFTRENFPMVAIEDLLAGDIRYVKELALLAMSPPDYGHLREVAATFWSELRLRGHEFDGEGFTDHVWAVLREFFPGSAGAAWDHEWAAGLMRLALRYVAARRVDEGAYRIGLAEEAEISAAAEAEDRARYRAAVRAWARAAVRRTDDGRRALSPTVDGSRAEDGEKNVSVESAPTTTHGSGAKAKKV